MTVEPQGLPVPHPERLQRPVPQPAAVLRADPTAATADDRRDRHRSQDGAGDSSQTRPGRSPAGRYRLADHVDGRDGGVPDPATARSRDDPDRHRGRLPARRRSLIHNQPVDYNYNRRNIVVLNVTEHALFLGPAERADVIVDFSAVRRQDPDPLQRRARAGPGVRPAHRLLHGRPGPDRHRRRAVDAAGLRAQHPDHHADPGGRRRPRAAPVDATTRRSGSAADRRCRPPSRPPRTRSSCRRPPTTRAYDATCPRRYPLRRRIHGHLADLHAGPATAAPTHASRCSRRPSRSCSSSTTAG